MFRESVELYSSAGDMSAYRTRSHFDSASFEKLLRAWNDH